MYGTKYLAAIIIAAFGSVVFSQTAVAKSATLDQGRKAIERHEQKRLDRGTISGFSVTRCFKAHNGARCWVTELAPLDSDLSLNGTGVAEVSDIVVARGRTCHKMRIEFPHLEPALIARHGFGC